MFSVDNNRSSYGYKSNNYNSYNRTPSYTSKPITSAVVTNKSNDILWRVGDKLNHITYGMGIVLSVKGELIEVAFKDSKVGVKTMLGKHPSLSKE